MSFAQDWDRLSPVQQAQAKQALAVADAIREAVDALESVPAGEIYARISDFVSLASFHQIVDLLQSAGKLERRGLLLVSTNPKSWMPTIEGETQGR